MTGGIHQALAGKDLLPTEHLVDTAYVSVDHLLNSRREHNINLLGPSGGGGSWQQNAGQGFDVSYFGVDWAEQTMACPQGKVSQTWHLRREKYGHAYWEIRFNPADCQLCPHWAAAFGRWRGDEPDPRRDLADGEKTKQIVPANCVFGARSGTQLDVTLPNRIF